METGYQRKGAGLILTLSIVGLLVSLYLLYHHTSVVFGYQSAPSFCSVNDKIDCDAVAASPYSMLAGVPLAALSALYYMLLIGFSTFTRRIGGITQLAFSATAVFITATALLPTIAYLLISIFFISAVCLLCITLDVLNFILVFVALRSRDDAPSGSALTTFTALYRAGARSVWQFFTAAGKATHPDRTLSLVSMCCLIFAFLTLSFLPYFLVVRHFAVRETNVTSNSIIEKTIDDWSRAPESELAISNSPERIQRDFQFGEPDAPVEVVIFSDFQCPYCRRAAEVLHELSTLHNIRVVFKNYPLDSQCNPAIQGGAHEFACITAQIARCAGLQGEEHFWQMHDLIFSFEEVTEAVIAELRSKAIITELGLEPGPFDQCMSQPDLVMERIRKDVEEGARLRLAATPTVFVNRKRVKHPTTEVLTALIEAVVQNASTETPPVED